MSRAFCYWPLCRGSLDWLVMWGVLQGRWCHLLLFAWCLHSGCLLWWFFFFLWRSCWASLQNSTSSLFLQDSRLAVSGCVPAASISSLVWWSTVALFLWSFTVYCWTFYVTPGSQSPFSVVFYENCLISPGHPLTHPRFCSCITAHFSLRIVRLDSGCQFPFPILFPNCVILCKSNSCQFFPFLDFVPMTKLWSQFCHIFPLLLILFSRWYIQSFLCSLTGFCFKWFFCLIIDLVLCVFYFCDRVTVISILYFVWNAAFFPSFQPT